MFWASRSKRARSGSKPSTSAARSSACCGSVIGCATGASFGCASGASAVGRATGAPAVGCVIGASRDSQATRETDKTMTRVGFRIASPSFQAMDFRGTGPAIKAAVGKAVPSFCLEPQPTAMSDIAHSPKEQRDPLAEARQRAAVR